jgi:hypothetical protein
MASPSSVKDEARQLVESLDDDATWEDVLYLMYLHEKRARGSADSRAGRTATLDEVRRRFGIATT